jgi:hypothetical protein
MEKYQPERTKHERLKPNVRVFGSISGLFMIFALTMFGFRAIMITEIYPLPQGRGG